MAAKRTEGGWKASTRNRIVAGAIATAITALMIVAIHALAAYYAAGPMVISATELTT